MFDRLTTAENRIEQFSVWELVLPTKHDDPQSTMEVENQSLKGTVDAGNVHFRFAPKSVQPYSYTIRSNDPEMDGKNGELTSVVPDQHAKSSGSPRASGRFGYNAGGHG